MQQDGTGLDDVSIPTGLKPFICASCQGPLVITDAQAVRCPYCGMVNAVPEEYRALVLARTAPVELARAQKEWVRFKRTALSQTLIMLFGAMPSIVLTLGPIVALALTVFHANAGATLPELVGELAFLPMVPALFLSFYSLSLNIRRLHIPALRLGLAARPAAIAGGEPGCRQCGAPLNFQAGDLFARCAHCGTESLVTTDALHARALVSEVESLQASALEAIAGYKGRVRSAVLRSSWRIVFLLLFLILPLRWAFGGPRFQTTSPGIATGVSLALFGTFLLAISSFTLAGLLDSDGPDLPYRTQKFVAVAAVAGLFAVGLLYPLILVIAASNDAVRSLEKRESVAAKISAYEKSCESGDAESCFDLARMYDKGDDVEKDEDRASAFYDKACEGGYFAGCNNLAVMYERGEGVTADSVKAAALYSKACDAGDYLACKNLGSLFERGDGISKDLKKAATLFEKSCEHDDLKSCRKACELGEASACRFIGDAYESGRADDNGHSIDNERAASFYEKACAGGDALACNSLARMYDEGRGVMIDKTRAASLYAKACDAGNSSACNSLGFSYQYGEGVAVNMKKAAAFYDRACDSGSVTGCFNLALLYSKGVAINKARAAKLYTDLCDHSGPDAVYSGYANACNNLALMYESGEGVPKDDLKAVALYAKACESKSGIACFNLAKRYETGEGVAEDASRATLLYEQACALGYKPACEH